MQPESRSSLWGRASSPSQEGAQSWLAGRTGLVLVMLAEAGLLAPRLAALWWLSQPGYGEEQGQATITALLPHSPAGADFTAAPGRVWAGPRPGSTAGSPAGTEPCCRCCPGSLPASVLGTRVLKSALTTPRGWMRCQRLFGLSHMRSLLIPVTKSQAEGNGGSLPGVSSLGAASLRCPAAGACRSPAGGRVVEGGPQALQSLEVSTVL